MLADPRTLEERAVVVNGALEPLADSLAADLDRLLPDEDVFVPPEKARMTRQGGRCPRDGAFLEFDPRSPRRHRCPTCLTTYEGEEHYRWWIMGYQLWLAERAVHAAALWRLRGDVNHQRRAESILTALADRYPRYPNEDNVLGPTRVFFSTYLESIWMLQLAVAVSLLERNGASTVGNVVRVSILAPSSELIGSFNEGLSNRQVWNSAALGAAGVLLGKPALVERALFGDGGLTTFLRSALLGDGSWYEGENYHLFAHRGLWYLVTLADHVGAALPPELVRRFELGFTAPLKTALPDFTFPARRDSQYRASLRQWRVAESLELGLARAPGSAELAAGLGTLYREGPGGDAARWRSTAEAERNVPGVRLTRADLGWKSLLFALPRVPDAPSVPPASALMAGQGFGVIRRDPDVYVALDYGHTGGSHGHPDRLNFWLVLGDERVFEDVGTGSYVERELHWYRSTLAHNAPLVDGRSQDPVSGSLRAWDERDGFSWIDAEARVAQGVLVRRSLVVGEGHVVDRLEWRSDRDVTLDLPIHIDADLVDADWSPATLDGGAGLEDGFGFVREAETAPGREVVGIVSLSPAIVGAVHADVPYHFWRAVAPGPPRQEPRRFLMVRARGRTGRITSAWSWEGRLSLAADESAVVVSTGRGDFRHRPSGDTWEVQGPTARKTVLSGSQKAVEAPRAPTGGSARPISVVPRVQPASTAGELTASGAGLRFEIGESHYRRTEASWAEAGAPTATVTIGATESDLLIETFVRRANPNFAPARDDNPLDNEHPDVNSDGVQVHLTAPGHDVRGLKMTWLMVPEGEGSVRITPRGDAAGIPMSASWRPAPAGWQLLVRIGRAALGPRDATLGLDVVVNEMPSSRERRRGQLVLSGSNGDWAYLRGDRQDANRLMPMVVRDA